MRLAVAQLNQTKTPPVRPAVAETKCPNIAGQVLRNCGGLASNWIVPHKLLFLGAGCGVTPLMSMARWLCDLGADVDVKFFNSVRGPNDIIFRKELELLTQRHRIFTPIIITSTRTAGQEWMGPTGRISRRILELAAPDLHERQVYMCGPAGFMESAKSILAELQFDPAKLHSESFDGARATPSREAVSAGGAETGFGVEFARAGKVAFAGGHTNLLEFIEAQDVGIDYGRATRREWHA